jgi:hypothetical protein
MALSNAQKDSIHARANAGGPGNTGSALSAEFGVSASTISNIKNKYTPSGAPAPAAEVTEVTEVTEVPNCPGPADAARTRTVIINSNKIVNKSFEVPADANFGQMMTVVGGDKQVEGIFTGSAGNKTMLKLKNSSDPLPDTNGEPLHIYLAPVKTAAGK